MTDSKQVACKTSQREAACKEVTWAVACRQVVWVAACNQAECRVLDRANATTTLREDSKVEACRYYTKV